MNRAARAARVRPLTTGALLTTLAVAGACWALTLPRMSGMDMGVQTSLGSITFFLGLWAPMMAAMMLPGAAAAVVRAVRAEPHARVVPLFLVSYLGVWTLLGLAAYAVYRPHSTTVAGAVVVAAGLYELTPLKRRFRRRCLESRGSGLLFGIDCVGSSIGLMLALLAVSAMSVIVMALVALLVLAQKLLPERAAHDVPLAAAIIAFGLVILLAPAAVPGLTPPM
ncbi:MAG TPA: DUF2182 domain-containing protein [Solirubrobacteraceae bacterium]|jgi:predicted metal-binding membrane protein